MTSWSKKKFDRIHKSNPYAKSLRSSHLRQQIKQSEESRKKLLKAEDFLEESEIEEMLITAQDTEDAFWEELRKE